MPQSWNHDRLDDLSVKIDRGFEGVERRFEHVDERFAQIDKRFEAVDKRFEGVEKRLERLDEHSVAVRVEIRESAENTQRMLIQALLAIVTLMIGGFSSLIVLIATQL